MHKDTNHPIWGDVIAVVIIAGSTLLALIIL